MCKYKKEGSKEMNIEKNGKRTILEKARPFDELRAEWKAKEKKEKELKNGKLWFIYKPYFAIRGWYYEIRCFLKNYQPIKEIIWFFQRGWRGYSDRDTWCYSYYLADVIQAGLKHLKKYQHGYPGECKNVKEWDKVLEQIIWTFQKAKLISDGDLLLYTSKFKTHAIKMLSKEDTKKLDVGFSLFKKYFYHFWD